MVRLPTDAGKRLHDVGYLADSATTTTTYLTGALEKPLLVEGPAGIGKPELAKAVSRATGAELVRLQCYEGLDEARALYEWNYKQPTVLLVDEVDKTDVEVEGLLLEVLSDFQVTIPEMGTVAAVRRPFVVLTPNASRELSEALKRRCLYLHLDYPGPAREKTIVLSQVPGIAGHLAGRLVDTVSQLRELELKRATSIAESVDWAPTLIALEVDDLDEQAVEAATLWVVLKHASDHDGALAALVHGERAGEPTGAPRPVVEALEGGDLQAMQLLAVTGVDQFGAMPGRGAGLAAWSSYNTLQALDPDTLVLRLARALRAGCDSAPRSDEIAMLTATRRVERFRSMVESDVRRRVAEDRSPEYVARTTLRPSIEQLSFTSARRSDIDEMRRQIYPLARRLATRLAKEQHARRRGPLDFRRTVRASLSTGGVPLTIHQRPRRPHRTELVVLCDVSGSVASFASFTLLLVYALREQFAKVRAFTFVDDVHEVTGDFRAGADPWRPWRD